MLLFTGCFLMASLSDKIVFGDLQKIVETVCYILASSFGAILYIIFSAKVQFVSRSLKWLGKISFEIYIFQGFCFLCLKPLLDVKEILFVICSFITTIVGAKIINLFSRQLFKFFANKILRIKIENKT